MKLWLVLFGILANLDLAFSEEQIPKNKISVDVDGYLRYERCLPLGFEIGTNWKYVLVIEGTRLLHIDQEPDIWFLTIAHVFNTKLIDWENRLSMLHTVSALSELNYSSILRKSFYFDEHWGLSPFVQLLDYGLDPSAYREKWPDYSTAHHIEIGSRLGIELQLRF